jgi:hypothetical protein
MKILIFFLLIFNSLFSIKEPQNPLDVLKIFNLKSNKIKKKNNYNYNIIVMWNIENTQQGFFLVDTNSFLISYKYKSVQFTKNISIKDVSSVYIKRWKANKSGSNSYTFFPTDYQIVLNDNKVLNIKHNIAIFNKLTFSSTFGKSKIYNYFVDRRVDGVWLNCKEKSLTYPETNPNEAVFRKIIFIK